MIITVIIAVGVGLLLHYFVNTSRERYRERAAQVAAEDRAKKSIREKAPAAETYLALGKKKYATCASCHGGDMNGGSAPSHRDIKWLSVERIVAISNLGLKGPITVLGKNHNLQMPAAAELYSDYELAALITYMQYSNGMIKDKVVSIEQVQEARKQLKIKGLSSTVTAKEVLALPSLSSEYLPAETIVDKKTGVPVK